MIDEFKTVKVIYVGRRPGSKVKVVRGFIPVDLMDQLLGDHNNSILGIAFNTRVESHVSCFDVKFDGVVSGIYELPCTLDEKGRIDKIKANSTGRKFLGMAEYNCMAAWDLADREVMQRQSIKALEAKQSRNTGLMHAMDIVRKNYKSLSPNQRMPFKLWLIDMLERN